MTDVRRKPVTSCNKRGRPAHPSSGGQRKFAGRSDHGRSSKNKHSLSINSPWEMKETIPSISDPVLERSQTLAAVWTTNDQRCENAASCATWDAWWPLWKTPLEKCDHDWEASLSPRGKSGARSCGPSTGSESNTRPVGDRGPGIQAGCLTGQRPRKAQTSMSTGAAQTVTVYLTRAGEVILVRRRAEAESSLTADLVEALRPGASFMGQPWEFWVSLGPGRHEVPVDA